MQLPPGDFPARLADAIKARGWTQDEAAAALGISKRSLGYYLAGTKAPKPSTWAQIAKALGLPPGLRNGYRPFASVDADDDELTDGPYAVVSGQRLPLPLLSVYTDEGRPVVGIIALPVKLGPPQVTPSPKATVS